MDGDKGSSRLNVCDRGAACQLDTRTTSWLGCCSDSVQLAGTGRKVDTELYDARMGTGRVAAVACRWESVATKRRLYVHDNVADLEAWNTGDSDATRDIDSLMPSCACPCMHPDCRGSEANANKRGKARRACVRLICSLPED